MQPEASNEATAEASQPRKPPPLTAGRLVLLLLAGLALMAMTCPFTGILLLAESGRRVAPVPVGAAVMGAVAGGALVLPFLQMTRRKLLCLGGAMVLGTLLGLTVIPFLVGE